MDISFLGTFRKQNIVRIDRFTHDSLVRTPDKRSSRNGERFGPKMVASMGHKTPMKLKENAGRDFRAAIY